jgi:regulator of protease activity HflC (stomatin/prohibitin superfamily)
MTEFNPSAGGLALVLSAALFIFGVVVFWAWYTITHYHRGWVEVLGTLGGVVGTVFLIFGIFVLGGILG